MDHSEKDAGQIDGDELRVIDAELAKLWRSAEPANESQGPPIVRSFRTFARQCIVLFLLTLPLGIVGEFGWWTIPMTTISAYFMLGLEIVAEHVEDPFGEDEDDLDLEVFVRRSSGRQKRSFIPHDTMPLVSRPPCPAPTCDLPLKYRILISFGNGESRWTWQRSNAFTSKLGGSGRSISSWASWP